MSDKNIQFSTEDVKKVASAMLEDCLQWDNSNMNTMSGLCGYNCIHCYAEPLTEIEADYKHSTSCPTLIAMDLLTNI